MTDVEEAKLEGRFGGTRLDHNLVGAPGHQGGNQGEAPSNQGRPVTAHRLKPNDVPPICRTATLGRRRPLLPITVVTAILAGCSGPTAVEPPTPPRFEAPERIPEPVSTSGWEDSGYITPDGASLYFTYLRIDPITFLRSGEIRVIGPTRPDWPTVPPFDTLGAELYRARWAGDRWLEPEHLGPVINLPQGFEGDEWVSEDGNRILFSDGNPSLPDRPVSAIYYAERAAGQWAKPVLASTAGFPFLPGDENPHLTRDEATLFIESSRPGGVGQQDIWISTRVNGRWSPPLNAGPNVNSAGIDGSPFSLDGRELLWDDKGGGQGIRWASRRGEGSWSPSVVVLPGIFGDPSVTLAGDLYVVGGRATAEGFEADLYRARRR